jgi:uncharacterized protein (DUF3084 family)
MTLLDEVAGAWRTKNEAAKSAVAEIADALFEMGGSAHRDAVIDRVAIRRGQMFASAGLRLELVEAFDRYCAAMARKGRPALFHLPFGEGSRRWGLTRDVMRSVTEQPATTVRLLPADAATPAPLERAAEA